MPLSVETPDVYKRQVGGLLLGGTLVGLLGRAVALGGLGDRFAADGAELGAALQLTAAFVTFHLHFLLSKATAPLAAGV